MPLAPPLLELEDTVQRILAQQTVEQDTLAAQFAGVRAFIRSCAFACGKRRHAALVE